MRHRQRAAYVQVGDLILTCYYPRTWRPVTDVLILKADGWRPVRIDTERDRTWWEEADLVPCKPGDDA